MIKIMGIVNLSPDSFWEPSRVVQGQVKARVNQMLADGADIIDFGAVSTRPGADYVSFEEEWQRLEPCLREIADMSLNISVDTTRSEIVKRAFELIGPFIVNDISAGEDDKSMLKMVGSLKLPYVAMHKRGTPRTMDTLSLYPNGIMSSLSDYFSDFSSKAEYYGIQDWILDPGLGFAKDKSQNWEILENLSSLSVFSRPILIGAADKRFTEGNTELAHRLAIQNGASILRVHDVRACRKTLSVLES